MIDSHCHLADEAFSADLGDVIKRSQEAGLERALVILEAGNENEEAQAGRAHALWPALRVSIGVHPHQAAQFSASPESVEALVREQMARTPYARAVGEIGLDYHYDYSPRDVQQAIFRTQIELARELRVPVVIHTREADADSLAIMQSAGAGDVQGVLHCFTGTAELAAAALDLGFYISLAGILTFPKASALREVARRVPLDRLLIETDSPFLAPVPHRGTRNEPSRILHTAQTLATLREISLAELSRVTTANFHALFRP